MSLRSLREASVSYSFLSFSFTRTSSSFFLLIGYHHISYSIIRLYSLFTLVFSYFMIPVLMTFARFTCFVICFIFCSISALFRFSGLPLPIIGSLVVGCCFIISPSCTNTCLHTTLFNQTHKRLCRRVVFTQNPFLIVLISYSYIPLEIK